MLLLAQTHTMSSRRSQSKVTPVAPPVIPKATVDQIKATDRPYTPGSPRLFRPQPISKRPRLSMSSMPDVDIPPPSSSTKHDADNTNLGKVLETHLTPLLQLQQKLYEESVSSQTDAIVALIKEHEKTYAETMCSQTEATLGMKNELREVHQQTADSRAGLVQRLEMHLSTMTKNRDECLKEMDLQSREFSRLERELWHMKKSSDEHAKEIDSLKNERSQLKESLGGKQRETIHFRQDIQELQKQLTSSRELAVAKSSELHERDQDLEALKAQTQKAMDDIKKGTENVVLEAEENVLNAEKNAEEAQKTIEEVKQEAENTQRQLQDEVARVRAKEVESKREIRRLLEVIRDAAPDKFREEVMKENFFDIMF